MITVNNPKLMEVALDKLKKTLLKYNIEVFPDPLGLPNMVVSDNIKILRIANRCFYRESGMCMTHIDGEHKHEIITKPITEDMWFNVQLRGLIEYNFNIIK